jgi:diguanylate cyclase (GGDEF)-like protein
LGATCAWGAARALRGSKLPWWLVVGPAMVTSLATWWEHPEGNAWPAGASLLTAMAVMLGLSAGELVAEHRAHSRRKHLERQGEGTSAVSTLMVASVLASGFYAVRLVTFLTLGPDSQFYLDWVGPYSTTFLIMLMLVVVTYTVTALSHYEMARGWRARAQTDDLTGMMHRSSFLQRAQGVLAREHAVGKTPMVVMADIDHFKDVNDQYGHPYGDKVLVAYAQAIRDTLGTQDFGARFGGEEFVILLADADISAAVSLTDAINLAFRSTTGLESRLPTVSYGVARVTPESTIYDAIQQADNFLYRAKREGRDRVVTHDHSL